MMFARRSLGFIRSVLGVSPVLGPMSLMPVLLLAATSFAQQTLATDSAGHQAADATQNAPAQPTTLTIPADTQVALVFTHPLNSKTTHRGDEIYVQTTAPVLANDKVAIPAGTFVQAKVNKLVRRGTRGQMSLDSVAFVFANGYIADVSGPVSAESEEGSAFANPTSGRSTAAIVAPFAGLGLGALIGSAAHTTHTSTFGGMSIKTNSLTGVAVGSTVGLVTGTVAAFALLARTHYFYVDAGSALEMRLPRPLALDRQQVTAAIAKAANAPPTIVVKRFPPPPPPNTDHGTCYTPGTPGTPDIVIPGTPAIGDSPGTPPTVIPGTPPSPAIPYPCP